LNNFIYYISLIKKEWDDYLKNSLSKYNITYVEFNGIEVLETKERLSSNILAGRMNLSPSRASRVIENMVKKNVIIRDIDCVDRRKCNIELTKRGIEIKEKIKHIKHEFIGIIMQNLDEKNIKDVNLILKTIIQSIQSKN